MSFYSTQRSGLNTYPKNPKRFGKDKYLPCKSQTFYPHSFARLGQIFHQFYLVDKTTLVSNMTQKSFSKKVIMFNHGKITSKNEILINQLCFFSFIQEKQTKLQQMC